MPLIELSDAGERAMEDGLLTLAVAAFLSGILLVFIVPDSVLLSIPRLPAVLLSTAVLSPVSYLLVRRVRGGRKVTAP